MPNPNNPTADGLATALWDVFLKVQNSEITPSAANASTNAASAVVRVFVQKMNYAKMRNEVPEIAFFANPAEMSAEPRQINPGAVNG